MYKTLAILFLILFTGSFANAVVAKKPRNGEIQILNETIAVFVNQECASSGTCDLKWFRLNVQQYKIWVIDGWHYGAEAVIAYETDRIGSLENYSVVQFIRGCIFDSYLAEDGGLRKLLGYSKPQFSEFDEEGNPKDSKIFCFPEWVIDSVDKDPVFASFPGYGRFYARRWNAVPGSHDRKTEKYYGEEKPALPILYMHDLTSGAFLGGLSAVNTSLKFRTCIYKTKDIPLETTEDNIDFAKPIQCLEWQNIFIYNYETKDFEMKFEIDPFCLRKPSD